MPVCPLCGWDLIYHGFHNGGSVCPLVPKPESPTYRAQLDAAAVEVGRRISARDAAEDLIAAWILACLRRA